MNFNALGRLGVFIFVFLLGAALVPCPVRAELLLVEVVPESKDIEANTVVIFVSGIKPDTLVTNSGLAQAEHWLEWNMKGLAGVSTWGFMNLGVEATVGFNDNMIEAGVTLEGTFLKQFALATGAIVELSPVPVGFGKHLYLFGKAYRVFYLGSESSPKPAYIAMGGVEARWEYKKEKQALRVGFGRTLADGLNCPSSFDSCRPDSIFELTFISRF